MTKTVAFAANAALLFLTVTYFRGTSAQLQPVDDLEPVADYYDRLNNAFEEEFSAQNESFALWIGIADPDYGDLYFVFGNATGPSPPQTPATLDQVFDIGSISKTMGGVLMIRLAEEGLFALEDTVQDLVPEFTEMFPEYANHTIEELLRMKTIVPDFLFGEDGGLLGEYVQDITQRYTIEESVAFAMRRYPAPIGTYSTTNSLTMDYIAGALKGQSIIDLVQEYVFSPLNLANSTLPDRLSDGVRPDPAATPYFGPLCYETYVQVGYEDAELYGDATEFSRGIVVAGTGGAITSNIYDLLTWAKSGTGDDLLAAAMVEKRHIYDSTVRGGALEYGMAQHKFGPAVLFIAPALEDWYGHTGDTLGFGANAVKNDALNGVAVATAINTCQTLFFHDMVIRITTEELQKRYGIAASNETTTSGPTTTPAGTMPPSTVPAPTEAPTSPTSTQVPTPTSSVEMATMTFGMTTAAVAAVVSLFY